MDEATLRQLFEACDVGWYFAEDSAERARQVGLEMKQLGDEFDKQIRRKVDVERVILSDSTRFKPLVQAFAAPMTTPMRTMVFCVLDGAQVKSIRFEYKAKQTSELEVEIEYDSGEVAAFKSADLWDAEVLRHFGLMKLGGKPIIDGYYAFRKEA